MTTRTLTRHELLAVELGRAVRFSQAVLDQPAGDTRTPFQARVEALHVLIRHHQALKSRFGPAYAEEAQERGLLP
jgi:hypothetical protein